MSKLALLLTFVIICCGAILVFKQPVNVSAATTPPVKEDSVTVKKSGHAYNLIRDNCIKCHGPEKQKGKVRLDSLFDGSVDRDGIALIEKSMDHIIEGEMPPEKKKVLSPEEKQAVISEFEHIIEENMDSVKQDNQTVYRRLNRLEYLNSVSQLFGFDKKMFDPTVYFPADQREEGINRIGSELLSSKFLTKEYLQAANAIVDKTVRFDEIQKKSEWDFPVKRLSTRLKGKDSAILYGSVYSGDNTQGCEVYLSRFSAPDDGFYEIKVKAEALNRIHDFPVRTIYNDQTEPMRLGIKTGHHSNMNIRAVFDLEDKEKWYNCRVWLNKGESPQLVYTNGIYSAHHLRFSLAGIKDINERLGMQNADKPVEGGKTWIYRNVYEAVRKLKIPKIHVRHVKVEGPFYDKWTPAKNPAVVEGDLEESWKKQLVRFSSNAFRRPVKADEISPYIQLVENSLGKGAAISEAYKSALKAIICSPRFLFLPEKNTKLDDYEFASRLAYFLWASPPDAELLQAAAGNRLQNREQLVLQVERMIKDDKAENFIESFTESWLKLYDLGGILPHTKNFRDFYSLNIQESIRKETYLYFAHILRGNRNVREFLDSDYTFLDRRLAKLYRLDPPNDFDRAVSTNQYAGTASTTGFVKYNFKDGNRGGLMGHASVLTVSANGIDTSPVVRGVWVLEKLLCNPPLPVPEGVPAIDPDTRGAKSLRDRLIKHKTDESCATCHKKIDPIGFALENYNAVGQWRSKYRRRHKVDPTGELNGKKFKNIGGLKEILLNESEEFGDAFAEKMLTYALGRKLSFLDDKELQKLQSEFKKKKHRMKDLILLICLNPLFSQK